MSVTWIPCRDKQKLIWDKIAVPVVTGLRGKYIRKTGLDIVNGAKGNFPSTIDKKCNKKPLLDTGEIHTVMAG